MLFRVSSGGSQASTHILKDYPTITCNVDTMYYCLTTLLFCYCHTALCISQYHGTSLVDVHKPECYQLTATTVVLLSLRTILWNRLSHTIHKRTV